MHPTPPPDASCCYAWVQTYSGRVLHPHQPDRREFLAGDFARGLAREPRFNGQTRGDHTYSVAQHCVLGAEQLRDRGESPAVVLAFLVHDGAEWVFHDLSRPALYAIDMAGYVAARERFQREVNVWAGLTPDAHEWLAVVAMDAAMLATEKRDLMGPAPQSWGLMAVALDIAIEPWPARRATAEWFRIFHALRHRG